MTRLAALLAPQLNASQPDKTMMRSAQCGDKLPFGPSLWSSLLASACCNQEAHVDVIKRAAGLSVPGSMGCWWVCRSRGGLKMRRRLKLLLHSDFKHSGKWNELLNYLLEAPVQQVEKETCDEAYFGRNGYHVSHGVNRQG